MKIALGTVQFGLNYGVVNLDGKVSESEVKNILRLAHRYKIDTLDTASNYGDSERVLGNIGVDDYQVITKTGAFSGNIDNVLNSFFQSLYRLKRQSVKGLLIHNVEEIKTRNFDILYGELQALKQRGFVKKIGFSTYSPKQIDFILENFDFDLVQLPLNVFDTRLIEGGQLNNLKNKGVEIHSRSVFLQGLLLDFYKMPKYFDNWRVQFNRYQEMVNDSGLSLLENALGFVLGVEEVDKVLVGVNSERHLQEIIQIAKVKNNANSYPINDVGLLNPSLWEI